MGPALNLTAPRRLGYNLSESCEDFGNREMVRS
jgi:hypothetical protein